jgi:BolA protein
MNSIDLIKMQIKDNIGECDISIYDDSDSHRGHFNQISETIPSHMQIKVISDNFHGMNLISRHRKINDIMKPYFDKGLHALKIIAKTKEEVENESYK